MGDSGRASIFSLGCNRAGKRVVEVVNPAGVTEAVRHYHGSVAHREQNANEHHPVHPAVGLVEGAQVKVISRVDGDVIVNVKGARLALNRAMSSHVMVSL